MLLVRDELRHAAIPGGNVVTLGVFDGVHRGHRALVARVVAEAATRGLGAGVVTFHPNPVTVLRPDVPFAYLQSLERRVELLREVGAAWVAVLQFTSELALVSAEDFTRMLVEDAGMRVLVVGENFHLGRGREGDVPRLRELGARLGFEVVALPLVSGGDGEVSDISSTRIRRALATGEMREVAELLGRPFALRGPVLHGDERGRTIGFPTLNIGVSADQALPPNGVYVTRAEIDGNTYHGATNIGTQPTFEGTRRRVETHLLDFDGDLYGAVVRIELLQMLRPERKFEGVDALVAQIERDVAQTRAFFA
ncbi:MAG: bifunctional riboflavin kinase/FAD synthetase [Dehalococcoidia bacterium]